MVGNANNRCWVGTLVQRLWQMTHDRKVSGSIPVVGNQTFVVNVCQVDNPHKKLGAEACYIYVMINASNGMFDIKQTPKTTKPNNQKY